MAKFAVLISGSGTNLKAILDAGLTPAVVIADRYCTGLGYANEASIPVVIVDRREYGYKPNADWDRDGFTRQVVNDLRLFEVDLVAMAGFMTIFEQAIFEAFPNRVLNLHPALLPAFKGDNAVRDALVAGVKVTGCTVHVTTMELDDGPILGQETVPILDEDDEASLLQRIHEQEWLLYPRVIKEQLAIIDGEAV